MKKRRKSAIDTLDSFVERRKSRNYECSGSRNRGERGKRGAQKRHIFQEYARAHGRAAELCIARGITAIHTSGLSFCASTARYDALAVAIKEIGASR